MTVTAWCPQIAGNDQIVTEGLQRLHPRIQLQQLSLRADALRLAEGFAGGDRVVVILGDNLVQNAIGGAVREYEQFVVCDASIGRLKRIINFEAVGSTPMQLKTFPFDVQAAMRAAHSCIKAL